MFQSHCFTYNSKKQDRKCRMSLADLLAFINTITGIIWCCDAKKDSWGYAPCMALLQHISLYNASHHDMVMLSWTKIPCNTIDSWCNNSLAANGGCILVHDTSIQAQNNTRPTCSLKKTAPTWIILQGIFLCILSFRNNRVHVIAKYIIAIPTITSIHTLVSKSGVQSLKMTPDWHARGTRSEAVCWLPALQHTVH